MSEQALHELCAASLERWTVELSRRVGPADAAMLLRAASVAALEAAFGIEETASILRQDAERLAAMAGPVGHA